MKYFFRTFLFAIALVAWGWSALWPYDYVTARHSFRRALHEPIAAMECDLSKPGSFSQEVRIDYPYGHGLKLVVDGPARTYPAHYAPEHWLRGLKGTTTSLSPSGEVLDVRELMDFLSFASGPNSAAIVRAFPGGSHCTLQLDVTRGAPALQGVPHRLLVYNDVCGCELMASAFMLCTLVLSVPIASAESVGAFFAWKPNGRPPAAPPDTQTPQALPP